jgi:hypothetical protein
MFLVLAYCGALHGEEVPLIDLEAPREFTASSLAHSEEKKKQAVIALHGRFKNKVRERCHLMSLVPKAESSLMPVKWMQRMLDWYA